ncbi:hypothetical protein JCM16303_001986 [Sporobolomyces ruberrimus]
MEDPRQFGSSSFVPPFASRTIYDQTLDATGLHRHYTGLTLPTGQCACSECYQGTLQYHGQQHHQQQPTNAYFAQPQYTSVPAPYPLSAASTSTTPYEYPGTNPAYYAPSQSLHRADPTFFAQYDSPSGSTTPVPTPPSLSPCYFPSMPTWPTESSSTRRQPKAFMLPNPALHSNSSFETSSVGQPIPVASGLLMPPTTSHSAEDQTQRRRENSQSSFEGGASARRRSSTFSVLSGYNDGQGSDQSDGGENTERLETVTPFVSKLAYLLRESTPWIRWNAEGTAFFFAHHRDEFGEQLARVFRHGSSHSFVRQLNIYNFKRLTPSELEQTLSNVHLSPGLTSVDYAAFAHPLFQRGPSCDLAKIKPKTPRKASSKLNLRTSPSQAPPPPPRNLRSDPKFPGAIRPKPY